MHIRRYTMDTLNLIGALLLFGVFVGAKECEENLVNEANGWVVKGAFARKLGECQEIYHCDSNGFPQYMGNCNGTRESGVYYSLDVGTCANAGEIMDERWRTRDCEGEELRYNSEIMKRRKDVCAQLIEKYGTGQGVKRLYSGDPDNCQTFYNCQAAPWDDWVLSCPKGRYFSEEDGECTMLEDSLDRSKCNRG